jgi:hypothetical protein
MKDLGPSAPKPSKQMCGVAPVDQESPSKGKP